MAYRYYDKNVRPFTAICECNFGRKVITTNKKRIDEKNIVEELNKALTIHRQNAREIDYLERYYRGDQPILYRKKVNRPEVNNKVLINLAYELVERKVAGICAEAIQYVLRGTDDKKSQEITELNAIMDSEDKQDCDIDICRWRSICGTAYRFIGNDERTGALLDESEFSLSAEDPRNTFVVYYPNGRPAFSCQIREDEDGKEFFFCYTESEWFQISESKIVNALVGDNGEKLNLNGFRAVPVIEYPNNSRRLSDIEITLPITDSINTLSSDRINGIEQFVAAWIKFVNCEIDKDTFNAMRQEGALVVKSNNGSDNKADVDVMTTELNQTESQVVFDDLFNRFLEIQGLANRASVNSGGDTGNAVSLRNGYHESNLREAIDEPIIKKSERMALRIILNRLRIKKSFTLLPSDIEIHINRDKLNNIMTKSEALQILLNCGIHYKRAIKTVGLFNDSERVAEESKKRMEILYPEEIEKNEKNTTNETKVIE